MIVPSIKWRLQLWYGLILLAVLAGFGVLAFQQERGRLFQRIDGELQRRVSAIAGALRPPAALRNAAGQPPFPQPPPAGSAEPALPDDGPLPPWERMRRRTFQLPEPQAHLFDESGPNGFYYVVWARDGHELSHSTNAPEQALVLPVRGPVAAPEREALPADGRRRFPGEPEPAQLRGTFREVTVVTPPGEIIRIGRSVVAELLELRRTAWKLAGMGGGVWLLGLAGGWWIATRAIRPIDRISETAARISRGDLSQRIDISGAGSELGRLAAVLNDTFARLEAAFARQQQFTSDAAHELRTPVSVILTQTQSTLSRERPPAEYRETLEACQRAAQRMRKLIESLLELARLDAGPDVDRRQPLDLAQVVEESVALVQSLAADRRVRLHVALSPAPCHGNADHLTLVVTNLLTNAIHYNREGGEVRIITALEDRHAVVTVADTGIGIAAEHVPHIFGRFYRADAARTAAQGRTGLGLAITKSIVEVHGGTIEVTSEPGRGSSFKVRLPV